MRAKIGFIGSGWRAHGYWKVIKELTDRFEVAAILTHSGKSREIAEQEYPVRFMTALTNLRSRNWIM